jgi:hypothetical protein
LNGEFNVAATFKACLFLVGAIRMAQTALAENSGMLRIGQCFVLVAIFFFLACDEFFKFTSTS